ncbi:radical SAM protein [Hydrogenimonas sp. SS33]|uniref:radical SAM protein n=1 Tax=Hydrogenimonas leucolamina TaxID=2954236 RepID=UPI00336BFCB6
MTYRTIFGPIPSRRFGTSLGIDLSPGKKQCNYDCLYCELAAAKPVESIENPPSVEEVAGELKRALTEHPDIDVITVTANGEPTLYPCFDELIDRIDAIKNGYKTLILSNASTIDRPDIQKSLAKFDMVKLSLDCATPQCFKKLDRPLSNVDLECIIEGIRQFRRLYKGGLILEILMVKGINTTEKEIDAFNRILPTLHADRIDIGTVDRPPAYPIEPLDYRSLHAIAEKFDPKLPIHIAARHKTEEAQNSFSESEILSTLAKRPLTKVDIETLFDTETMKRFEKLLAEGKIEKKEAGNLTFYGTAFSKQKAKKSS